MSQVSAIMKTTTAHQDSTASRAHTRRSLAPLALSDRRKVQARLAHFPMLIDTRERRHATLAQLGSIALMKAKPSRSFASRDLTAHLKACSPLLVTLAIIVLLAQATRRPAHQVSTARVAKKSCTSADSVPIAPRRATSRRLAPVARTAREVLRTTTRSRRVFLAVAACTLFRMMTIQRSSAAKTAHQAMSASARPAALSR
mmetsp:Transcript_9085/g.11093  ORF Transcript_9085/g.11093 Transcript_9085/m.11093 type:complete len:201 (-) Transcript_9085:4894-5496(-)